MVQKWPDVSHSFWWYFSNVQVAVTVLAVVERAAARVPALRAVVEAMAADPAGGSTQSTNWLPWRT